MIYSQSIQVRGVLCERGRYRTSRAQEFEIVNLEHQCMSEQIFQASVDFIDVVIVFGLIFGFVHSR